MGESQWFQPTVKNKLLLDIVLAHFVIEYGKFYDIRNPFVETKSVQGETIHPNHELEWGHSGRQFSPTGTEGSFEIHLKGERIAEIYWDCPFSGKNEHKTRFVKQGYNITFEGFNRDLPALGRGIIIVGTA